MTYFGPIISGILVKLNEIENFASLFHVFRSLKILIMEHIFVAYFFPTTMKKNVGKIGPILIDSVSLHYKICIDCHLGKNVMF